MAAMWLEKMLAWAGKLAQVEQPGRVVQEIGLLAYREILHAPCEVIYCVDAARVVILALRRVRRACDPTEVDDV